MGMSVRIGEGTTPAPGSASGGRQPPGPEAFAGPRTRGLTPPARQGKTDADVIILGGGPAGSTLGAYLARAGIDHLILDKAVHPRRHVGESLVCSTTRIFDEIGFLPVMEREGFVRKYGANWVHWAEGQQCSL